MGIYRERRNYVDHDPNSITILIDGENKVEGFDSLVVELDNDESTVQTVADGTGLFVANPTTSGEIRISFIEASPTNDIMWALLKAGDSFKISVQDANAPLLDAHGNKCRVKKRPVINRGAEADVVEWVCSVVYLDCAGGSYSLASA